MNGPAWAFIGFFALIELAFLLIWRWRLSRDRSIASRHQLAFRCICALFVVAAVVIVPAAAKPGSQEGLARALMLLCLPALLTTVTDVQFVLRTRRSRES